MTATIRSLVLLSACILGAACQDKQPSPAKPSLVPEQKPSSAPAKVEEPPAAALSAVAPTQPKSILDAPSAAIPENVPVPPKSSATKAEPETSREEPATTASDAFDRALSPEEVKIDRFVLATGVAQREPIGESSVFAADTKIFAFVQLANEGAPYAFRVHWEPLDGPSSPVGVKLNVATASRFRTWSWTAIAREPGRYKAVLRTLDGAEIASREFEIAAKLSASPSL